MALIRCPALILPFTGFMPQVRAIKIITGIREEHMNRILVKETYKDGQVIIKEGSFGEGTYVILDGRVEISKTVNNEKAVITTLGKGDIFGEMSFIDRQPRSASVIAIGDVKIGILDKDFLENEINKTSEDFRLIITAVTQRLRKTTGELMNLKIGYHEMAKR